MSSTGKRSDFVRLAKMSGLKKIKTHTSNIPLAGTDGDVMVRLR